MIKIFNEISQANIVVNDFSAIAINPTIYQEIFSRQQILTQAMPYALIQEIQSKNNLIQSALQNETIARMNEIIYSRNFLSSALIVQDAAIDFLSEMKKIDGYEQKTLGEILKEIRRKKKFEDLPIETQESFLTLEEFVKIFWNDNKEYILGIFATSDSTINAIQNNDFSNIFTVLLFIYYSIGLLMNCKNFEVNDEN